MQPHNVIHPVRRGVAVGNTGHHHPGPALPAAVGHSLWGARHRQDIHQQLIGEDTGSIRHGHRPAADLLGSPVLPIDIK